MNAKEKVSNVQFLNAATQNCAFMYSRDSSVFVCVGVKGWEKRLIISDRAHIGKSSLGLCYLLIYA